ncbi:sulfatase-like hydrolase/transferase [Pelagicoccus mobilis]|uniref:Sulfatase-like hydrolase/transferase n=1 Tax=Pelagicoccus mobilis TaxID=415221 RepID=A0A934RYA7_9BACT|nr:sulfatase-like hydrolase/transferase [Pelagicoccus mobilis]
MESPNIILVMADDQGWGQVGYNGHPTLKTPHLDAMAEAGIRLDRFYAAGPVCSPTRASVLTGRTHVRTGVPDHGNNLCLQEKTLPQALQEAGYSTALFGKWHLNGVRGAGVPILEDDPNHPGKYGFDEWLSVTNYFDLNPLMSRSGAFEEFEGDSSNIVVAEALKFMEREKENPTLAVIWYGSPHGPQIALPEDRAGFEDDSLGNHLGEIVGIDRSIGLLRKGLRELGIEDNTLIWYCSDNGGLKTDPDACGGLRGLKGSLFEGGIRVPGIIEWPGRIKPMVTDFPASTMDIMPTLVDLLDLPKDSQLEVRDGESLLTLLGGGVPQRAHPIPFYYGSQAALIDGDFKLIGPKKKGEAWRLYNLKDDPSEGRDLSSELPELFSKMRAQALATVDSIEASAVGEDYPEGRIIQKTRRAQWYQMKEYAPYFEMFLQRPEYARYKERIAKSKKSKKAAK